MKMTVDTGEMKRVANLLKELAKDYSSIYQQLLDAANTMGDAWKAPDNQVFVDQIKGFLEEFRRMTEHIDQSAQTLEQQAGNYNATVDDNIDGAKHLAN